MCFNLFKKKKKTEKYYIGLKIEGKWVYISPYTRLDSNDRFFNSLSKNIQEALSFDSLEKAKQYVNYIFNTVLNRYEYGNRKGIDEYDEVPNDQSDLYLEQLNVSKFYVYGFLSHGWYCTVKLMIVKEK